MKKCFGKNSAFTLAEVLITLGIIGVVAAITMSVLVKNCNKHVWVNQLKESYSMLSQGFQMMLVDESVSDVLNTGAWSELGTSGTCTFSKNPNTDSKCKKFLPYLKKYFKITSIEPLTDYSWKYLNSSENRADAVGSNRYAIYLANGTMLVRYYFKTVTYDQEICNNIRNHGGHICKSVGYFYLDVNGKRGPNEIGRDIFYFYISEQAYLIPRGGKDMAIFYAAPDFSEENINSYKVNQANGEKCDPTLSGSTANSDKNGDACTALIMEDMNWKMDY